MLKLLKYSSWVTKGGHLKENISSVLDLVHAWNKKSYMYFFHLQDLFVEKKLNLKKGKIFLGTQLCISIQLKKLLQPNSISKSDRLFRIIRIGQGVRIAAILLKDVEKIRRKIISSFAEQFTAIFSISHFGKPTLEPDAVQ